MVDHWAKQGARRGVPAESIVKDTLAAYQSVGKMADGLAQLHLAYMEKVPRLVLDQLPARPGVRHCRHAFVWEEDLSRWICRGCCRARKANPYLRRIGRCPLQASGLLKAAMLPQLGHVLAAAALGKGILVFCRRCGCYSQHRVRALNQACPGLRQTGQANALMAGRHPTTKEAFLGRPWKLWAKKVDKRPLLPVVEGEDQTQGHNLQANNLLDTDAAWQHPEEGGLDEEQEAADFLQFGA